VRRPVIAALAWAHGDDVDAAAAALEHAERSRLNVFIGTSEIQLRHKLRIEQAACIERAAAAVERARRYTDDVEFTADDAMRTDIAFLCRVIEAAVQAGARTVNVTDMVGHACPSEIRTTLVTLFRAVPGLQDATVSVHCHDDLGLALANTLAGVEAGARQVECTVNGIGERAGNAALEEVVMALHTRRDVYSFETGIHATEIARSSHLLAHLTGIHPPPNKAIVGRNAFAHEAGAYQAGSPSDPLTYEVMTPESVGVREPHLVLGRHSGRQALARRYRVLGYELDDEELDRVYELFKLLAQQKRGVLDEDLLSILHHGTMEDVPQEWRLRGLDVVCGSGNSSARVRVAHWETEREAAALGDGPLAAAFAAIDSLVDFRIELQELSIQAVTPGGDAVGEVSLQARIDGKTFRGRGASPDIVNAGVRAYLHALNKAAHARELEAQALERASYSWGV
jgi:2-isopropylmalate synthase